MINKKKKPKKKKKEEPRGYLPLMILSQARDVNSEIIYPNMKNAAIQSVDDEKMVLNLSTFSWVEFIIWTICFSVLFIGKEEDLPIMIMVYLTQLGFLIMSLSCIIKYNKRIIFNRKEGTISYPRFFLPIKQTIPFSEAKFMTGFVGEQGESFSCLRLRRKDGISWVTFNTNNALYFTYIWYMDKNRPLPPGTAFDPYRQKDYERRRSEGFPPPLFDSYVHTPDIGDQPDRYNQYTTDSPGSAEMWAQMIEL